jgi:ring-1,2-phenylacetyl-CoA epoxidase subunit PaaB
MPPGLKPIISIGYQGEMQVGATNIVQDTQWPRYEVFLQELYDSPYQDVGSVHAVDAEMALLNARNVFARRPECFSMWVVPVAEIYPRTRAQLETWTLSYKPPESTTRAYSVFVKKRAAGTHTLIGEVQAANAELAMNTAINKYGGKDAAFVWWVLPSDAGLKSRESDIDSMYSPAAEKKFRLASDFHTLTAMRSLRNKSKGE